MLSARKKFPRPESFEQTERKSHPQLGTLFRRYVVGAMLVALGFADWALVAFHASRTGMLELTMLPLLYAGVMARGRAYGLFFALFGLAWWGGSTAMGWLYERSLNTLVVFSVATQLAAVPIFVLIGRRLSNPELSR